MADTTESGHGDNHVGQLGEADDTLPERTIVRAAAVVVLSVLVLSFTTYVLIVLRESELRPARLFPERELRPHAVARLTADVFDTPRARPTSQEDERRRLGEWGWVDRARQLVHIPVDQAIEMKLRQAGAKRAP